MYPHKPPTCNKPPQMSHPGFKTEVTYSQPKNSPAFQNKMSSKAFGGATPGEDEYLELSDFLGQQRTKYDELRTTYRAKQKNLKDLEAECEHLARITHLNDTSTDIFKDKSMALNKQLEEIRGRTEDGQFRSATYHHMLNRLEDDRLLLDKQLERLQHSQSMLIYIRLERPRKLFHDVADERR